MRVKTDMALTRRRIAAASMDLSCITFDRAKHGAPRYAHLSGPRGVDTRFVGLC